MNAKFVLPLSGQKRKKSRTIDNFALEFEMWWLIGSAPDALQDHCVIRKNILRKKINMFAPTVCRLDLKAVLSMATTVSEPGGIYFV